MSRIERLNDAQIVQIPEFVERWTEIGLCTQLADRPRAELAIGQMYRQGGLDPPKAIVWCGSPLSQALAPDNILDHQCSTKMGALEDGAGASVMTNVMMSIRASVMSNIWASVRDGVCDSVWHSIGDAITTSVWGSVRNNVWACVCAGIGHGIGDRVYGAHDAGWLAFYRYFRDVVGLRDQTAKLVGLWELAQSAGWVLPQRNICWVSERHHILARDGLGRLHSLIGPACAFPDGWSIYAVHGVRVPQYAVEHPAEISVGKIDIERNADVRRVMIERYRHGEEVSGCAAYIRDAGGERLDHDERFGTLWRRNIPNEEPIVMVEVVNSTCEPDGRFKHYWLRVPPQTTSAHEAIAWSFDVDSKEYTPQVET